MALLCGRAALQTSRRTFSCSVTKYTKDKSFADPLDHATGIEKRELLAAAAGNFDPYNMKAMKISTNSTKDQPNLVPSAFKSRMIGCVCEQDAAHVNWLWLHHGHSRRCECGHWFKLIEKAPL